MVAILGLKGTGRRISEFLVSWWLLPGSGPTLEVHMWSVYPVKQPPLPFHLKGVWGTKGFTRWLSRLRHLLLSPATRVGERTDLGAALCLQTLNP